MTEWLQMGGYAAYVWPAYAVFFLVLAWDWLAPSLKRRRLTRALRGRAVRERSRNPQAPRVEASP